MTHKKNRCDSECENHEIYKSDAISLIHHWKFKIASWYTFFEQIFIHLKCQFSIFSVGLYHQDNRNMVANYSVKIAATLSLWIKPIIIRIMVWCFHFLNGNIFDDIFMACASCNAMPYHSITFGFAIAAVINLFIKNFKFSNRTTLSNAQTFVQPKHKRMKKKTRRMQIYFVSPNWLFSTCIMQISKITDHVYPHKWNCYGAAEQESKPPAICEMNIFSTSLPPTP